MLLNTQNQQASNEWIQPRLAQNPLESPSIIYGGHKILFVNLKAY